MGNRSHWGKTPRQSIETECERRGKDALVAGCMDLLTGRATDSELIVALGGPPAHWAVSGDKPGGPDYWFRVWAARGLLWAWEDKALPAVLTALSDDSWRVREMAVKVVARHELGDALPIVTELRNDPVVRVRRAAERAVIRILDSGA